MTSETAQQPASSVTQTTGKPQGGLLSKFRLGAFVRMGWGVADQAVSSLTNYAVSFFLVHTLAPAAFGAFSLTYVTYGFALTASRGLTTDPLLVRYSGVEVARWRRATGLASGTAIIVGLAFGSLALIAATIMGGSAGAGFLALGLTLPGLMLQDCWRYCFFAMGRGFHALLNDSIWAVALVPGIAILRITGHADVFWVVFVWGATACIAAAVGPIQARVLPQLVRTWAWLHVHRDLGPRYLAEGTISNSAYQIRAFATSGMLGLVALGCLQASVTIFGPINILFLAMGLVTIPEAARVLRNSPSRAVLFCIAVSTVMSAIAAVWGITLLIGFPLGLGRLMLGPIWRPTYPLVLPSLISALGGTAATGTGGVLHALGASRKTLRLAIFGTLTLVILSFAGAALLGAAGVVWGTALAVWIATGLCWWQLRVAIREANLPPQTGLREVFAKLGLRRVAADAERPRHRAPRHGKRR